MTLERLLFLIFAVGTCGGALGVVLARAMARMAFWLVVSLGSVAGLFFLLHADFLAAAQLLIYVGGTVVLLIFGVMLTAGGRSPRMEAHPMEWLASLVVGTALLGVMSYSAGAVPWEQVANRHPVPSPARVDAIAAGDRVTPPGRILAEEAGTTTRPLGLALLGLRLDAPGRPGYLLPFEIISLHLLVVLIGAAYLARAKRRTDLAVDREELP